MKSRLAQTLCVLCLVSLRAHYPKHFSSRPLPLPFPLPSHHTASSGSHFARPVCSAMFSQWIGWEASPSNCWAAKAIDQYIVDNADNGGSLPARRERKIVTWTQLVSEHCSLSELNSWVFSKFTSWVLLGGFFSETLLGQCDYDISIYQYIDIGERFKRAWLLISTPKRGRLFVFSQ